MLQETSDGDLPAAEEEGDFTKGNDDLDLEAEEERFEPFISNRRRFATKSRRLTSFETKNFYYFNAYCLAKILSDRSQAEFMYPILRNGRSDFDRSSKEQYLLYNVPTGCYNFHPEHCFPNDTCLHNYISIVDLSIDNNCIEQTGVAKAIIGLAKISSVDEDLIEKIGGFKRLTKWFAFACFEHQTTHDASAEALNISTCLRAAHIFLRHTKKLPDFENFAGFVSSKLEKFVDFSLSKIRNLNVNSKSDEKRHRIVMDVIRAVTDVECGFAKYSSLNEAVQNEVIDLAVTSFGDYLLPGYCQAKSKREKFIFCVAIRGIGSMMEKWNVMDESFYRRFFEFCRTNYDDLEKNFGPLAAAQWIEQGLTFILDVSCSKHRTLSPDFIEFVLEAVRPFVISKLNKSVACLRRTECLVLRARTKACLKENFFGILSKDDLENIFVLLEKQLN